MDDRALQTRLDAIERRQSVLLWLLVGGYVLAALWLLVTATDAVTVWNAGVAAAVLAVLATAAGIARRRRTEGRPVTVRT
jgi:hypothetical protein